MNETTKLKIRQLIRDEIRPILKKRDDISQQQESIKILERDLSKAKDRLDQLTILEKNDFEALVEFIQMVGERITGVYSVPELQKILKYVADGVESKLYAELCRDILERIKADKITKVYNEGAMTDEEIRKRYEGGD